MRQGGQLARQTHLFERRSDVLLVGTRTDHAFQKSIGLTELETYLFGGLLEARAFRPFRPEREHALFLGIEILRAARQALENAAVLFLGRIDALGSLARGNVIREFHLLVHDVQSHRVVYESAVGGDLRVDPAPEGDVVFEIRRTRKRIARHCRTAGHEDQQEEEAKSR